MTIQFNRGLMLAAIEDTFNEAQTLNAATDAFEVIAPEVNPDITSQRRAVLSNSLSPFESLVTRKVGSMTFQLEVKSNGNTAGSVPPRVGRLLRACGFQQTQIDTAAENIYRTLAGTANTGDLNFYGSTTTYTGGVFLKIKATITTGGASGVAVANFSAPAEATRATQGLNQIDLSDTDEVILTDGQEITLHDTAGNAVVTFTPDFQSTNPATGDVYWIYARPIGYVYTPKSDDIDSVTIDMQFPDENGQSIRHRITGARGTVAVNATVGEFPTFTFTFTGTYVEMVDEATKSGTFETQDPVAVEFAALALAQQQDAKFTQLCASSWSIDMQNEIVIRDCINESEASEGAFLVSRDPVITYDPEAVLKAVEPIWSYMEEGTSVEWWVRHGIADGNIVLFHAPNSQITNIAYADRNSIRAFEIDGALARLNGDDELQILFT